MSGALSWTPIAVPDFGQALAQQQNLQANRLQMLAAQRQLQQGQAMDDFLAANAQGFAASDPTKRMNLLAMLAQQGPQGLAAALPQMQSLREEQTLTNALPLLGLGGAPASPGAPAGNPAPGGTPGLARPDLIPEGHRAADGYGAHIDPGALRNRLAQRFGLSAPQAAGMVSGLHGESGLRTGIVRPGGADYGLAQWVGPRRRALFAFAEAQGRPAYDPEVQIAFLEREIEQNPRILDAVRQARDPVEAANAFHNFLSGGAAALEHTRPLHTRAAAQIAAAQPGESLVLNSPRAIPVAAGDRLPPAATEGGGLPSGPLPVEQAQRMGQGITSDQYMRFVAAVANNPAGIRVAQQIAPFVRQGEATEIREMGAQGGNPAGLYLLERNTGRPLRYIGPSASQHNSETERNRARYIELDARRDRLTPQERMDLAMLEREMMQPRTQVGADGSVQQIQPLPLPRAGALAAPAGQGAAPATLPIAAPAPSAPPASAIPVQQAPAAPGGVSVSNPLAGADATPTGGPRIQTVTLPTGQTVTQIMEQQRPPAGYRRRSDGMLEPETGGPEDPATRALTETQGRANQFGLQMQQAERIFANTRVPNGATILAWRNAPEAAVNLGLSANDQQYFNAVRLFAAGVLRRETGAAFTQAELADVHSRFFSMPGDSVRVRQQKAEARRQVLESLRAEMPGGRFRGEIAQAAPQSAAPTAPGAPPPPPFGARVVQ